jgi:hypothetical protein
VLNNGAVVIAKLLDVEPLEIEVVVEMVVETLVTVDVDEVDNVDKAIKVLVVWVELDAWVEVLFKMVVTEPVVDTVVAVLGV